MPPLKIEPSPEERREALSWKKVFVTARKAAARDK
jgi:hypothetical protein